MKRLGTTVIIGAALLGVCVLPTLAAASEESTGIESDPLEPMNRGVFWFNNQVDRFLLEPAAHGWQRVTPQVLRDSLEKFFENLRFPVRFVSNVIELNGGGAAEESGRFVVNSTVGVLGFFDPASGFGLEMTQTDIGVAFGRWGIPPGPYLVLPLFGPSNPRDTVGLAGDSVLSSGPSLVSRTAGAVLRGVDLLNTRAELIDEIDEAREASLDYYVFMRNAYVQHRSARVRGESEQTSPGEVQDDLYEIDDEEE